MSETSPFIDRIKELPETTPVFEDLLDWSSYLIEQNEYDYNVETLSSLYESYYEQIGNPKEYSLYTQTSYGNFQVPYVALGESSSDDTIILLGGAAGPAVTSAPYGVPLGIDNRIILLPHMQSGDVMLYGNDGEIITNKQDADARFAEISKYVVEVEKTDGLYYPQAEFIANTIEELFNQGKLTKDIHLVGFSNGGPTMARALQILSERNSRVVEYVDNLILMNSGGFYDPTDLEENTLGLQSKFAWGYTMDNIDFMIQNGIRNGTMLRQGTTTLDREPLLNHIPRNVSSVGFDILSNLPDRININMIWGEDDQVFPAGYFVESMNKNLTSKDFSQDVIQNGTHNRFRIDPFIYVDKLNNIVKN